ncbi:unnamed protein product [Amoebophrya sp. A25]|nr:unnamed protein product [Amoebophrya sp. A25]|eukprot:GSA25T00007068001.1
MKGRSPFLLGLPALYGVGAARTKGDAVGKVMEMLSKMIADGEAGKAKEAEIFKGIEKSVANTITETNIEIEHQIEMVEKYTACKEASAAEASLLGNEVEGLQKENSENAAELSAKTALRKEENAEFLKTEKDLMESVDALTRAIQVIKSQPDSVSAEFLQNTLSKVATGTKATADLEAFLQQPQSTKTAYDNQSGGLMQMLDDLLADFSKQLKDAQKGESNSAHAFTMFKMDMENEIENIDRQISSKTQTKGEAEAKSGECATKEATAADALASAKKMLKETKMYFKAQSDSFAQNQKVRTEELEALNKAIDIMKGDAVTTGAEKHIPGFLQESSSKSFLQLSSVKLGQMPDPRFTRVEERLSQVKSKRLAMLSVQMMTGGTFDKIIGMIKEMIDTLTKEMEEEMAHKAWCDKELSTTEKDRDTYRGEVDALTAKKEGLEAKKAAAEEEIARLTTETSELKKTIAETTAERQAEKKENEQTIAEASAAQQAVAKAIEVLDEFYGKSALLQTTESQPVIESYGGMGDSNTGVVGLMQTIESKFSELESDTRAAESMAATTYKEFMAVSKKQLEKNRDAISDTKIEAIKLDADIARTEKALTAKTNSLKAAQEYWGSLQPMCVVKKVSYEERVSKREEEIAALKEAYKILEEQ